VPPIPLKSHVEKDTEGFEKVLSKRRSGKKPIVHPNSSGIKTRNRYDILSKELKDTLGNPKTLPKEKHNKYQRNLEELKEDTKRWKIHDQDTIHIAIEDA
jgi:hypothetical protein